VDQVVQPEVERLCQARPRGENAGRSGPGQRALAGNGSGYLVENRLRPQQSPTPEPSHNKSTAGRNGIGDAVPLPVTRLFRITAWSALGSMSANASGGRPASAPSNSVLPTAIPVNWLPETALPSTVARSAPTIRIPEPLGTNDARSPGGAKLG